MSRSDFVIIFELALDAIGIGLIFPILPALLKELIRQDATPQAIADELSSLHVETPRRHEVLAAFRALSDSLGGTDCLEKTADLARSLFPEPARQDL